MTSIGSPSPFFLAGKKAYEVERSLRFNSGDSADLQRTPSSAGNRKVWTWSSWIKRSSLSSDYRQIFRAGATMVRFKNDHTLMFERSGGSVSTASVFRDVSAWYHIVFALDTTQSTESNRIKLWVNNIQQTLSGTFPAQNTDYDINNNVNHFIGQNTGNGEFFDGYMAEINFIDGQAYDPSYFGETDAITGQWNPKKYIGSYGTNGFYLNFSDNSGTTATTLGKDSSGNGNNFTPNNFSVSAGVGNDSVTDTPTNNFATLNGLNFSGNSPSNGNLQSGTAGTSGWRHTYATFAMPSSGKWYWEVTRQGGSIDGSNGFCCGLADSVQVELTRDINSNANSLYLRQNQKRYNAGAITDSIFGASSVGSVIQFAFDADTGSMWSGINNTWTGANPSTGSSASWTSIPSGMVPLVGSYGSNNYSTINFGQQGFTYTPPTGFQALNSANLPDPTIKLPNKHFDTVLYTGDGNATGSQTNVLEFQPDWLWSKPRNASYVHLLYDSVRGAGNSKSLNLAGGYTGTGAEGSAADNTTYGFLNSFDASGFSYTKGSATTTYFNQSSINYVVWNWNAGNTDVKTYTVKVVSDSGNKYRFDDFGTSAVTLDLAEGGTYTFDQSDSSMSSHPMQLSTTANGTHGGGSAYSTGVTYQLDGSTVTASAFISGFSSASSRKLIITVAASAPTLYYYCYYHSGMGGAINTNSTLGSSNFDGTIQTTVKANTTAGFSIVLWTGNGSSGATIGHGLGVTPNFAFAKSRTSVTNWATVDFDLQTGGQLNTSQVFSNGNYNAYYAAQPSSTVLTLGSNGATNGNTNNYVAYVFSEVAGYSKFGKYTGNGSTDGTFVFTGFRPALIILKRTNSVASWVIHDDKRAGYNGDNDYLHPDLLQAESDGSTGTLDILSNGFKLKMTAGTHNGSGDTYIYLAFAQSPFKNARAR